MDSEKRENIKWSLFLLGLVAAVFFSIILMCIGFYHVFLWELDLRDILHEILSISDVRLTDQDGKWIQITWESLQEYFVGVKIK